MMLACCLEEPAPDLPPGKQGVLSVRSQQNFLSKSMKQVTGVITLEDGKLFCPLSLYTALSIHLSSLGSCDRHSAEIL